MRARTIRCWGCAYWEAREDNGLGECHRMPPGLGKSNWPVTEISDWCGEFRSPKIAEKELQASQCHHIYPQVGCSKCMDLYVDVDKDGVLSLHPHKLGMPVPKSAPTCHLCLGEGCIACLPDSGPLPTATRKPDRCLCGGVGCNSCEPGGRG